MNKNEYDLTCTSVWDKTKIMDKYPVLKNYEIRTEYPYPNPDKPRLVIKVDDLRKFYDDIGEEIIIAKDICDNTMYSLEIYDDYRE